MYFYEQNRHVVRERAERRVREAEAERFARRARASRRRRSQVVAAAKGIVTAARSRPHAEV